MFAKRGDIRLDGAASNDLQPPHDLQWKGQNRHHRPKAATNLRTRNREATSHRMIDWERADRRAHHGPQAAKMQELKQRPCKQKNSTQPSVPSTGSEVWVGNAMGARGNTGSIVPSREHFLPGHEGREQRGAECDVPAAGIAKRTWQPK